MNPRILKKLCKRSVQFLERSPDRRCFGGQVLYTSGDSLEWPKVDRKHLERWSGKPNVHGYFIPKKNTIGYGKMSGYYEHEWEDEPAYTLLRKMVADSFVDWDNWDEESYPVCTITIKTPADVFKRASELWM